MQHFNQKYLRKLHTFTAKLMEYNRRVKVHGLFSCSYHGQIIQTKNDDNSKTKNKTAKNKCRQKLLSSMEISLGKEILKGELRLQKHFFTISISH